MAELASGAVSSLLGVIRNEAALLGGVRGDVQFIKEEMESMNSFLEHLARTVPPSGEHDPQVRTWMGQVRLLAQDCNNCIDLYLYRGNPEIHLPKGGPLRYLWWAPWFLRKLVAQHRAAVQLRELKDRARDVGERRMRYGVEVPAKAAFAAAGKSPSSGAMAAAATTPLPLSTAAAPAGVGAAAADDGESAGDDDEEDGDDQLQLAVATPADHYSGRPRAALLEAPSLDDYFQRKLVQWMDRVGKEASPSLLASVAIVAPDTTHQRALALARETLVRPAGTYFDRSILVDIPALHHKFHPLRPKDILFYILRELRLEHDRSQSQSQQQGTSSSQGEGEQDLDGWEGYYRRWSIYFEKREMLRGIKEDIQNLDIHDRLEKIKIKSHIQNEQQKGDLLQLQMDVEQMKNVHELKPKPLHVLFQLLLQSAAAAQQDRLRDTAMLKLAAWHDQIIQITAEKLEEHMEDDDDDDDDDDDEEEEERGVGGAAADETAGGGGGVDEIGGEATAAAVDETAGGGGGGGGGDETGGGATVDESGGGVGATAAADETAGEGGGGRGGAVAQTGGGATVDESGGGATAAAVDETRGGATVDETRGGATVDGTAKQKAPICLYSDAYKSLLREVFPRTKSGSSKPQLAEEQDTTKDTKSTTTVEDQLKEMIHKVTEMVQKLHEEPGGQIKTQEATSTEIERKFKEIEHGIKKQCKIEQFIDKIKDYLKNNTALIILRIGEMMDPSTWEETSRALGLLDRHILSALIVTTKKNNQQAKQYCYPQQEPIEYSFAGLYHDIVLELSSQQRSEDNNYNHQTLRIILDECQSYEFCMKIFAHSLYAKPKRSNEELLKLHSSLQAVLPKSMGNIAKKMFKFSYRDMPQEYKTCLLYLAIFPPGHKIRRSNLIGRWIAEGLITTEDWRWSSSVPQAERCFNALIDRWLIYPADIGATGKVKSCIVGDIVHKFINKIARKQRIVEARLSHHLARHFSVFNDLHLRGSDTVKSFLQNLSKSYQLSQLKVLDLDGCQYFEKNQSYLKNICNKMLLLKYLSLRGTDVTHLPSEINNLHELEVLDIRQTKVPASATRNLMLLKLKRLLAGHIDLSPSSIETNIAVVANKFSSVWIPEKIEKMVGMEVLSNVKGLSSQDLKDIGRLWQLRKLGVVITDKDSHLSNLLQSISDLHECLRSLSITLPTAGCNGNTSSRELPVHIRSQLNYPPKLLERLSVAGTTKLGKLLPLLVKYSDQLAKVTLSKTWLRQKDLKVLSKLPKLQCVRLRQKAYTENKLTFNKDGFPNLKHFLVEGSNMIDISFEDGATCDLKKIVLSFTDIESIDGVNNLKKLEELELNNNNNRLLPLLDNAKTISKVTLRGTLLNQDDIKSLANNPNICCLVLLDSAYVESQLTFNKDEFTMLKFLTVHCSNITKIIFTKGSALKLEKFVWSYTSKEPFSGIENLPRLKELEFNGDIVPKEVEAAIKKYKKHV